MKKYFNQFSKVGIALLILFSMPAAFAQEAEDFENLSGDSNSGALGTGLNVNDLIHLSNRLGGMTSADFQERQERKIDEAAADFRERQRQALESDTPTDVNVADDALE